MLKLVYDKHYENLRNKLDYVLENFNFIYQLEADIKLKFTSEFNGQDGILVQAGKQIESFFEGNSPLPAEYIFKDWKGQKLPFFFSSNNENDIINVSEQNVTINYDIISSAFYFLTSWQEWHSSKTDGIGRFPIKESFLYQHELLHTPVVNYYYDILKTAIEKTVKTKVKLRNKQMYCLVTHDIDKCQTGWLENSWRAAESGKIISGLHTIYDKFVKNQDVWFNFNEILEMEKKHGVNSTFFFIPQRSVYPKLENADYNLHSNKMLEVLKKITAANNEIGLHGSLNSGFDEAQFAKDLQRFPVEVAGNRFHFLAMNIPQSYRILAKTDVKYDSSLGMAEEIGFRNGFCYPFFPYDLQDDRKFDFIEFPLHVMDVSLQSSKYMNLTPWQAVTMVRKIVHEIKNFNGYFNILWHNSFFSGYKYKDWNPVFTEIITECQSCKARFLTIDKARKYREKLYAIE